MTVMFSYYDYFLKTLVTLLSMPPYRLIMLISQQLYFQIEILLHVTQVGKPRTRN